MGRQNFILAFYLFLTVIDSHLKKKMDDFLRCNSLPCRKPLQQEGKAVSTCCSHIFCLDCATKLLQGRRNCPACGYRLENADDAIVTNLSPSASYKASVLAGLSPDVIMEICTRAIAFYEYQATQEAAFQQMLLKKAQESVSSYEREVDRLELSARTEIIHLEAKVKNLQVDLNEEKRKTKELHEVLRSNGRDYEKLKTQFDQSRRSAIRTDTLDSSNLPLNANFGFTNLNTPSQRKINGFSNTSVPKPFFNLHEPLQPSEISQIPKFGRENESRTNVNTGWQTPHQTNILPKSTSTKFLPGMRTPGRTSGGSNLHRQTPRPRSGAGAGLGLRTPIRPMPLPPPGSSNRPRSVQRKIFEDYQ